MKVLRFPWVYLLLLAGWSMWFIWLDWQMAPLIEAQGDVAYYSDEWLEIEGQLNYYYIQGVIALLAFLVTLIAFLIHAVVRLVKRGSHALS